MRNKYLGEGQQFFLLHSTFIPVINFRVYNKFQSLCWLDSNDKKQCDSIIARAAKCSSAIKADKQEVQCDSTKWKSIQVNLLRLI